MSSQLNPQTTFFGVALSALLLAACSSSVRANETSVGEGEGTEGAEAADGMDDAGEESTETGGACEVPESAVPNVTTAFTIRNERDVAIYVLPYSSFDCNFTRLEMHIDGEPVLWDTAGARPIACSLSLCDYNYSCEEEYGGNGLIINPGAEAQIDWTGGVWRPTVMPAACELDCDSSCDVLESLSEETYTMRLNLSECPDEEACAACTEGVCSVFVNEPSLLDVVESFELSAEFPDGVDFVVGAG